LEVSLWEVSQIQFHNLEKTQDVLFWVEQLVRGFIDFGAYFNGKICGDEAFLPIAAKHAKGGFVKN
jgi:hypothetical protein